MKFTPVRRQTTQSRPAPVASQSKPGQLAPALNRTPSAPSGLRKNLPVLKQNQTATANPHKLTLQTTEIDTPKSSGVSSRTNSQSYVDLKGSKMLQQTPKFNTSEPQKPTGRNPAKPSISLGETQIFDLKTKPFETGVANSTTSTPKVRIDSNAKLMNASDPPGSTTDRVRNAPELRQNKQFKKPVITVNDIKPIDKPKGHAKTPSVTSITIPTTVPSSKTPQARTASEASIKIPTTVSSLKSPQARTTSEVTVKMPTTVSSLKSPQARTPNEASKKLPTTVSSLKSPQARTTSEESKKPITVSSLKSPHARALSDGKMPITPSNSRTPRAAPAAQARPAAKRPALSATSSVPSLGNLKPPERRLPAQRATAQPATPTSSNRQPLIRKQPISSLNASQSAPKLKTTTRQNPSKSFISPTNKLAEPRPKTSTSFIAPGRKAASPTGRVVSPARKAASPTGRVVSPARRVVSPTGRVSPVRKAASPTGRVAAAARKPGVPTRRVSPLRKVASPRVNQNSRLLNKTTSPLSTPRSRLGLRSAGSRASLNKTAVSPRVNRAKLAPSASVPSMPALRKFVKPSKAQIEKEQKAERLRQLEIKAEAMRQLEVQAFCNSFVLDLLDEINYPFSITIQDFDSPIAEQPEALECSEIAIKLTDQSVGLNDSLNHHMEEKQMDASTQSERLSRFQSNDMPSMSTTSWGPAYPWEQDMASSLAFPPHLFQMLQLQQQAIMNLQNSSDRGSHSDRTASLSDREQRRDPSQEKHDMETQYSKRPAYANSAIQYSPRVSDFSEHHLDTSAIEIATQIDEKDFQELSASVMLTPSEPIDRYNEKKINQSLSVSTLVGRLDVSPMNRALSSRSFVRLSEPMRKQFSKPDLNRTTDFSELKQLAVKKEKQRQLRHNAAIRIQSAFKSYMVRLEINKIKTENAVILTRARLLKIGKRLTRSFAPWKIVNALRRWVMKVRSMKMATFEKFRQYAVKFIQKFWRGYKVRRFAAPILKRRKLAMSKITALGLAWKTKKILKTKPMSDIRVQLVDTDKLLMDLETDGTPASKSLAEKMAGQQPALRARYINMFRQFYANNRWIEMLHRPKSPELRSSPGMPGMAGSPGSFDDQPIRPKKAFLRRSNHSRNNPGFPSQSKPMSPPEQIKEEAAPVAKSIKPFLKRTSKTIYAQKINFKTVPKRTDCWMPKKLLDQSISQRSERTPSPLKRSPAPSQRSPSPPIKEKSPKKTPQKAREESNSSISINLSTVSMLSPKAQLITSSARMEADSCLSVGELEQVFAELNKTHITSRVYFSKRKMKTKIPQLSVQSTFISKYDEEHHQAVLEGLENAYTRLCHEETID